MFDLRCRHVVLELEEACLTLSACNADWRAGVGDECFKGDGGFGRRRSV